MLSEEEAVASKVAALFSRGEARDYLDVAAILGSGRYDQDRLQLLAARADPGFRLATFAEALAAIDRFPDEEFARYGVGPAETSLVRQTMRAWSRTLAERARSPRPPRRPSIGSEPGPNLPEPTERGYRPEI